MSRAPKKVHIPLDFKEALGDLMKVKPEPEPKSPKPKPKKKPRVKPHGA